jgi:hypothetical protein
MLMLRTQVLVQAFVVDLAVTQDESGLFRYRIFLSTQPHQPVFPWIAADDAIKGLLLNLHVHHSASGKKFGDQQFISGFCVRCVAKPQGASYPGPPLPYQAPTKGSLKHSGGVLLDQVK